MGFAGAGRPKGDDVFPAFDPFICHCPAGQVCMHERGASSSTIILLRLGIALKSKLSVARKGMHSMPERGDF